MQVKDLEHLLGFRVHVLSPEPAFLGSEEEKNSKMIILWKQGDSVMVVIFCILFFV